MFVWVLIVLQVCASVAYGCRHEWGHAGYWFFSTGIIVMVTFYM
jgi:hypothetical protein